MAKPNISSRKSRLLRPMLLLATLPLGIGLGGLTVLAMPAGSYGSNNNSSCSNYGSYGTNMNNSYSNYPAPYTGGAPVARVFHLSDGSTVTITRTGAVIKQGQTGNPYREGWVNPSSIYSLNSSCDLSGQLGYGSTNPFMNSSYNSGGNNEYDPSVMPYQPTCNSSNTDQYDPSVIPYQRSSDYSSTDDYDPSVMPYQPSNSSSNASASANAAASINQAAKTSTSTSASPPSSSNSSQAPASNSANNQSFNGKSSLPDTGSGPIFALSGIVSVFGAVGHFLFQRLRQTPI